MYLWTHFIKLIYSLPQSLWIIDTRYFHGLIIIVHRAIHSLIYSFPFLSFHVALNPNFSNFVSHVHGVIDLSILLYCWIYCDKMIGRIWSLASTPTIFLYCHKSTTTNLYVTIGQDCSHREIWNANAWRMKRESKVEAISLPDDPTGRSAPEIVHRMSYFCMLRIRTGESMNRHPHACNLQLVFYLKCVAC